MSVWVGLAWVSTGLWNCHLCIIRIRLSWEFKDARFHCSGDDLKWVIRMDWNSENAAVGEMLIANQRQLFTGRTLLLGLWSNHLSTRGDVALTQRQRKRNYRWDFFFFVSKALLKCRYLPVCCICGWSHVFSATQPWHTEICLIRLWGLLSFCQVFQGLTLRLLSSRLLSPPNTCHPFLFLYFFIFLLFFNRFSTCQLISLSLFQ